MTLNRQISIFTAIVSAVLCNSHEAFGQHDKGLAPPAKEPSAERVGEPYYLPDCPISGKKLGAMGDPVIKVYDGREVRFCCPACPEKFENDKAGNIAKLDEKVIKDQRPLYPLKTSVVTTKDLPAKPYEFVYGNRLVRLGAEGEKAQFLKAPNKFLSELDKATIEAQGKDYPLKICPVSKDKLGGDMGKPVDLVVASRLIRLCCKECKKDIEKDPAKFMAVVDAARGAPRTHQDEREHHDGHDHKHEPHGH